jgi:hypothetical protein
VALAGLRRTAYTLSLGVREQGAAPWEWSFLAGESGTHSLLLLLPTGSLLLPGGVQQFTVVDRDASTRACIGNVSLVITEPGPVPRGPGEGGSAGAGSVFCTTPAVTLDGLLPPFVWARGAAPSSVLRQAAAGYRLEQLRVAAGGAVSFRLVRAEQPPGTVDWVYVRAVGPAIAVGHVAYRGDGDYTATLTLPLEGAYVIQVVRAWGELPERVVGSGLAEAEADDAVLGHAGSRADLVAGLLSPDSVAGHVLVPSSSPAFAQRPPCGSRGGMRRGVWVRSEGPWDGTKGRGGEGEGGGVAARDGAGVLQETPIDTCPLVQGGWSWQPYDCEQVGGGRWVIGWRELGGAEERCWSGFG